MEVFLKNDALTTTKEDSKQNVNLVEQEKYYSNKDTDSIKSNLKYLVKSQYILKKILSILGEKRKLLFLKYNKYYHKLMEINIHDFQKLSSKIIIGGINGYGKEYGFDELNLIFKGYYKNGKRNGEGKEYNYDDLIFEGEYINGEKNGKAIEYNMRGIMFKGEYLNGKRWNGIVKEYHEYYNVIKFYGHYFEGNKIGKEYDKKGQLIFEGKYLDDKKWDGIIYNNGVLYPIKNGNGKVKQYNKEGELIFEGEYINGEKNGKEYSKEYPKLIIFEGEYCNEKRWNGKIKEYNSSEHFDWCGYKKKMNDKIWSEKNITEKLKKYENIIKYEGEYFNGERNGKGKEYDIKGNLIFEGEYLNGKMKKYKNKLKNFFDDDYIDEYCTLVWEGNLKNGLKDGIIKEYNYNGILIFEGEYLNDERNGKGKEYNEYNGELIFEGEYLMGKRINKGKKYDKNGQLIYEGEDFKKKRRNEKSKQFFN